MSKKLGPAILSAGNLERQRRLMLFCHGDWYTIGYCWKMLIEISEKAVEENGFLALKFHVSILRLNS
ncbi:MAG: hypothetical protein CVU54_09180 [Deltaproteobacteria bacterium HGW-Deltaproteobacteria-12]|nr:MAG: hypothetical protein CVU54_09180 [Deltaproteobacteria bacterium HGW-Deltaproteobacteria-12]